MFGQVLNHSGRVCWRKRLEWESMGFGVEGDELANALVAGGRIRIRISQANGAGKTYTLLVLDEKQALLPCVEM